MTIIKKDTNEKDKHLEGEKIRLSWELEVNRSQKSNYKKTEDIFKLTYITIDDKLNKLLLKYRKHRIIKKNTITKKLGLWQICLDIPSERAATGFCCCFHTGPCKKRVIQYVKRFIEEASLKGLQIFGSYTCQMFWTKNFSLSIGVHSMWWGKLLFTTTSNVSSLSVKLT